MTTIPTEHGPTCYCAACFSRSVDDKARAAILDADLADLDRQMDEACARERAAIAAVVDEGYRFVCIFDLGCSGSRIEVGDDVEQQHSVVCERVNEVERQAHYLDLYVERLLIHTEQTLDKVGLRLTFEQRGRIVDLLRQHLSAGATPRATPGAAARKS